MQELTKAELAAGGHKPGTTILGGFHVTLTFERESYGIVSTCMIRRGRDGNSLAFVQDNGVIDGDNGVIEVPRRVIDAAAAWANARGY